MNYIYILLYIFFFSPPPPFVAFSFLTNRNKLLFFFYMYLRGSSHTRSFVAVPALCQWSQRPGRSIGSAIGRACGRGDPHPLSTASTPPNGPLSSLSGPTCYVPIIPILFGPSSLLVTLSSFNGSGLNRKVRSGHPIPFPFLFSLIF